MQCQSLLNTILEASHKYDLKDFYDNIKNLKKDLKISIAFLGEFSSGKSTLINALMGKKILPAMDEPTTAAIVEVQAGKELRAFIEPLETSNEIKEIDLADLSDYVFGDKKDEIAKVLLEVPENDFFKKGFKFVDTPGIQSLDQTHEDITFGYLPKVDAAVFVIDINQGGATDSLIKFLKEKVINEEDINKFIFVLNKADTKKPQDLPAIEDNLKKQLEEIIPNPTVISVSAKLGLEGKEEGNIENLKMLIKNNIISKKQELVEQRYCKELNKKGEQLISILDEIKNSLDLSTEEIDKEIEKTEIEIQKLKRLQEKINRSLNNFDQSIYEKIDLIAKNYAPQIMSAFIDGKEENAQNLISLMSNELKNTLTQELNKLSMTLKKDLDIVQIENVNLETMISTQIEEQLSTIKTSVEAISEMILVAIFVVLSPLSAGAEIGGAVAVKVLSKFLKREVLKAVGDVISKFNIPEKLLKAGVKKWKKDEVTQQIKMKLNEIANNISSNIKINIENFIEEEVLIPLETKKQLLNKLYEEKDKKITDTILKRKEIDNHILQIKKELLLVSP